MAEYKNALEYINSNKFKEFHKKNKETKAKNRAEMAKKMKTFHGRPIEELKKEAGIGKYKKRYE